MDRAKTKVLVVDDSACVRQSLKSIIDADPDLEVMATASDPFVAAARIQKEVPDVIILDVEMPRMDGLTFLRKIMAQHPIPVVMCSSLTEQNSNLLVHAMEAGAVDVIAKPRAGGKDSLMERGIQICESLKGAAKAKIKRKPAVSSRQVERKLSADAMIPPVRAHRPTTVSADRVVCIGASTGGTESLREVLMALPEDCPGIVIVQHMPEKFTKSFAERLNGLCKIEVKEAEDGDAVIPGRALIAPGNRHMLLQRNGSRYHVAIKDGPLVSRHRPSVDVLFRSAAQAAGKNVLGIIMTGMGDDGAKELLTLKNVGAYTVAQSEDSCVVFGMPKEAIELGAVDKIVPLNLISAEIVRICDFV
jgi:two-component system chemotaxis response regulator CheB